MNALSENSALNVLDAGVGRDMVERDLMEQCRVAFDRWRAGYDAIETPAQLAEHQKRMRRFFLEKVGRFPRRTSLNARIVGRLKRRDFGIEKVIFESQPQHYVTANLYLPATPGPHPAVLVCCGHNDEGKAAVPHQRLCALLARNGLAAFCYDPIAQGERFQYLTEGGTRRYWPTYEHTLLGTGCILLGSNTARYRIFDGMRALDYLQSRPDIDGERLGVTGYSGGGNMASYLVALDERIACAAPCCWLATLERVLEELGPQDAEQNIHGQVDFGMDHVDYLLMRAPVPVLICAATRDFFPIDGVWTVFRQAKRMYARLGFAERVDLIEDDVEHDFSSVLRVGAVRWMRRWLMEVDDAIVERDAPVCTEEELKCAPDGQVTLIPGARSGFDLNVVWNRRLARKRREFWEGATPGERRKAVREIVGVPVLRELPLGKLERVGVVERKDCRIDKLLVHVDEQVQLPALMFAPPRFGGEAYLYVHGEGKGVEAQGEIARLVRQGNRVLAVDVRGCGELAPEELWRSGFLAYLLGLSYTGMRTADVLVAARLLGGYRRRKGKRVVHLIGVGDAGPAVLHAAALEPRLFASLTLRRSLVSWNSLVRGPEELDFAAHAVHGALRKYDLADLLELLPKSKVAIEEPVVATTGRRPDGR
jgi:dienelactone hydrolase